MIRELRALLNRLLGRAAPPPPPQLSASQRAVESGIRIEYQGDAAGPQQAPASLTWQKERFGVPRFSLEGWRRRISARKRVLIAAGALAVVAQAAVLGSWLFVVRRLPAATFGVWATSAPAYAGRMFELRSRRVAFVTGDSVTPVTVYQIRRVRRAAVVDGQRYTVEYEVSGEVVAFQFIFTAEPQPQIHFVNQPRMAWARVSSARTFMPEIF
jgi:hypothetical protein